MIVSALFTVSGSGYQDGRFGPYKFNFRGKKGFGFLFWVFGITFWKEEYNPYD